MEPLSKLASPAAVAKDMDALVKDIYENPENLFADDLTEEQVIELQSRINPYAFIAGEKAAAGVKRVAAATSTNLRADYIKRFTMTSLVAFMFQMVKEWEVPADVRRWTPNPRKKPAPKNPTEDERKTAEPLATSAFDPAKLVERLEATLAVAKEAQMAHAEKKENATRRQELATKAKAADAVAFAADRDAKAAHEESTTSKGDSETREKLAKAAQDAAAAATKAIAEAKAEVSKSAEADAASNASDAKAAGLLYAATRATARLGLDAEKRIDATVDLASAFPEVKAMLDRANVRPGAGGQVEMPAAIAKGIVEHFIKRYLEFDPMEHVRSAHDAAALAAAEETTPDGKVDSADPERIPLSVIRAAAPRPTAEDKSPLAALMKDRKAYAAACALLADDDLAAAAAHMLQHPARFRRYMFPVPKKSPARAAVDKIPPKTRSTAGPTLRRSTTRSSAQPPARSTTRSPT